MYPIPTTPLNLNLISISGKTREHIWTVRIMPLTFLKKDFFQPINSIKPRREWGTCTPFLQIFRNWVFTALKLKNLST